MGTPPSKQRLPNKVMEIMTMAYRMARHLASMTCHSKRFGNVMVITEVSMIQSELS